MVEPTGIEALKQIRDVKDGEAVQVLRRLWEGDLDLKTMSYSSNLDRDVCAWCSQPWTHVYLIPNEHGGKDYIGYICNHQIDCLVKQIEGLIGVHQVNPNAKLIFDDGTI